MNHTPPDTGPNQTRLTNCDPCSVYPPGVDESQNIEDGAKPDSSPAPTECEPVSSNSTKDTQEMKLDASVSVSAASSPSDSPSKKGKKKKKEGRCPVEGCRKKVGLTGFQCRCGSTFCSLHRYSDAHACDFDYKALAREQLCAANPAVVAAKFDKI
eukprot:TRINITY_DN7520_c0_g1_i7.p1 TRINITY_DN7520_c0_g1~~TRINITY_DN7520_c0_g1_i7.p1  ORF type:complete len:156 (+),score=19.94 TRINITY_DN7520_c0_g1_i7:267-734(+)